MKHASSAGPFCESLESRSFFSAAPLAAAAVAPLPVIQPHTTIPTKGWIGTFKGKGTGRNNFGAISENFVLKISSLSLPGLFRQGKISFTVTGSLDGNIHLRGANAIATSKTDVGFSGIQPPFNSVPEISAQLRLNGKTHVITGVLSGFWSKSQAFFNCTVKLKKAT